MPPERYVTFTTQDIYIVLINFYEWHESNPDTLYSKHRKKYIASYTANSAQQSLYVRVYGGGGYKAIALHRAIWMITSRRVIPDEFEIHHIDFDHTNNHPDNLMCIYKEDHRKLHANKSDDEVPF